MLIYLRKILAAIRLAFSDFAPVITIFPVENTRAVVFGSRIFMVTAENLEGLYSALRQAMLIFLRSSLQLRFAVDTIFTRLGTFSLSCFGREVGYKMASAVLVGQVLGACGRI